MDRLGSFMSEKNSIFILYILDHYHEEIQIHVQEDRLCVSGLFIAALDP